MLRQIEKIEIVKNDLLSYANLGATITSLEIDEYCKISEEIKALYKQKEKFVKNELEIKFKKAVLISFTANLVTAVLSFVI